MTSKPGAPKNQRTRFIEAARDVGASESEAVFDKALGKVAKAPAQTPKKATKRKAKR